MNAPVDEPNRRVLVIDDNEAIHKDIGRLLTRRVETEDLDRVTAAMLGDVPASAQPISYAIDAAYQGEEGVAMAGRARARDLPYALAFVDMRMPPGIDGVETIRRLWKVDPDVQIIICTAFSDYSWEQTIEHLGVTDCLLILKKPFDHIEVHQLACALTEKWNLTRRARLKEAELEAMVASKTRSLQELNDDLRHSNECLRKEIEERQTAERLLRHNAFHDALTQLPNRALLMERLGQCITRAQRHPDHHFAVLFLDLDNFKLVNDSLGHRAGDVLLRGTAERLQASLRSLDIAARPTDNTTARLGGDEFVILLDGLARLEDVSRVAERISEAMAKPFVVDGHELQTRASVGIATSEIGYDDAGDMLRDADTALYRAKADGKGCYVLFNQEMRELAVTRLELERDLRRSVEDEQLRLWYQPIICLETGAIMGFEALVRWAHPQRGLLEPADFLQIAEEIGIVTSLGTWVVCEACRQLAAWRRRWPDLWVSVNFSSRQLMAEGLMDRLRQILEQTGLEATGLKLEVTETMMVEHIEQCSELLNACKAMGLEVFMDDFGKGYSSLTCLHHLPIDAVKLDETFVRCMSADGRHAATVQAVMMLAVNRGFRVIAEGVECVEDLVQLQALDCHMAQGYYFAAPLEVQVAEQLLSTGGEWRKTA